MNKNLVYIGGGQLGYGGQSRIPDWNFDPPEDPPEEKKDDREPDDDPGPIIDRDCDYWNKVT
jgi:hypothetical protein